LKRKEQNDVGEKKTGTALRMVPARVILLLAGGLNKIKKEVAEGGRERIKKEGRKGSSQKKRKKTAEKKERLR